MKASPLRARALAAALTLVAAGPAAAQPDAGDTFATATSLDPGELSVIEQLRAPFGPDLYAGAFSSAGALLEAADDGSPFGDGLAPALFGQPISASGGLNFRVTGFPDVEFTGDHFESGAFQAFVRVVGPQGDSLSDLIFSETLAPQSVRTFTGSNSAWVGGTYDVLLNNTIPGDVDFFRFGGLTPGAIFTAETSADPASDVDPDTRLGWFNNLGGVLAFDDDGGAGDFSRLAGLVPSSGEVVLAVTGGDDTLFAGTHPLRGGYELSVTLGDDGLVADYNDDGQVGIGDYVTWRFAYGSVGASPADGSGDGRVDAADYTVWRDTLAQLGGAAAVPEPTGIGCVAALATVVARRRRAVG